MSENSSDATPAPADPFPATHWSVVLRASGSDAAADEALAQLCQTYWYPIYAYVRRQVHNPEDAWDLTQGFFAHLVENHALAQVNPARGRLRSFLRQSCRHFLANEREHARALKRGGGQAVLSLDAAFAETRYGLQPAHNASPAKLYERNWALTLLEHVLDRLRTEQTQAGKEAQFAALQPCLMNDFEAPRHAEVATQAGLSPDAVKTAVSRLRRRYRELLREEIAQTVSSPGEVEEEIRYLFAVLAD